MPIYEYRCEDCGEETQEAQGIKDSPLKKCPVCGKMSLERLISTTTGFVRGEPTTVGQLAERNSKKMGRSQIQEKDLKYKEDTKQAKQEAYREINKMSPDQQRRFIENG